MKKNIWITQQVYFPDEVAGAYLITRLAEGLTKFYNVKVLCGNPLYNAKGTTVPKNENVNGVKIKRCFSSSLDKNKFIYRVINLTTISISIFINCLIKLKKNDIVLVVTTPPTLPIFVLVACKLKGAKCILKIDDLYPEILMATGFLSKDSILFKMLSFLNKITFKYMSHVIVIGRDMEALVHEKISLQNNLSFIPNWADVDLVKPETKNKNILLKKLCIEDKFIINYAGNMGYAQDIESILDAAKILKENEKIHFLFLGLGIKKS